MTQWEQLQAKVLSLAAAREQVRNWQRNGQRVVFTNGCFDLLHFGHLHYLAAARDLGERLVIGLNSTDSVRQLKGPHRPIQDADTRAAQLAALQFVDLVVWFDAPTPIVLIESLLPDLLVKGGDYVPEEIVGAAVVRRHGGAVRVLPFVPGYSSSAIEQRIRDQQ